jgi:predicted amidophosphoribosyltransferase
MNMYLDRFCPICLRHMKKTDKHFCEDCKPRIDSIYNWEGLRSMAVYLDRFCPICLRHMKKTDKHVCEDCKPRIDFIDEWEI